MRVAIVQHQPSVPPGLIADVLRKEATEAASVYAWRDDAGWPSIRDIDGLVVLGGTMNVDQLDEFPFLKRSRKLMSAALERGIPTLGVCLGSQMMARVLDAPVRRAEPRNALFSPLEITDEGRTDPFVAPFVDVEVLQFHEDTFTVPEGAVTLATSETSGLPQAFRYGSNAYAIQFHFEVDRTILERWVTDIGAREMSDEWGISDQELLRTADRVLARQAAAGTALVRRFAAALQPA